jgi:hypothetical protein
MTAEEIRIRGLKLDALTQELQADKIERARLRRERGKQDEEVKGLQEALWGYEASLEELIRGR